MMYTRENLKKVRSMERVNLFHKKLLMKERIVKTKEKVLENLLKRMEIFMTENGNMMLEKEKERMYGKMILYILNMSVNGEMINIIWTG